MTARKPDFLKMLSGTARPDRAAPNAAALPPIEAVPTAPAWLSDPVAVSEFNRLAPMLTSCKLLNAGNVGLLTQMCAVHGWLAKAWASGQPPTAAMISSYRSLHVALGLTHMSVPAPASKPNRFLNLKR